MSSETQEKSAMPKQAIRIIADSDRAKAPDFSIPKTEAKHHDAAAQYYEEAARHHRVAAKQEHAAEAAKAHAKDRTG